MKQPDSPARIRQFFQEAGDVLNATGVQLADAIVQSAGTIASALARGNKVLLCGNGGSAADAQHVAAELVGRFLRNRRALPAIALTTDSSTLTAIANDLGFERVFARQVEALGSAGDVLIAISTSGTSANIVAAARQAKSQAVQVIALTGEAPSPLGAAADITLAVPSNFTPHIQHAHIAVLHALCDLVERQLSDAA